MVPVPDFWTEITKNGIKVIGTKSQETPTVTIQLSINGGHRLEATDPKKAGLASMTAAMLNESTQNYSAAEISDELQKLGSRINVFSGNTNSTIFMSSLTKNLDATLNLFEEIMLRPKFSQEDFDRLKKQQLESVKAQSKQPTAIASNVYNRLLYGDNHIMSVPSSGIEETVENITLEDVKDFYNKYYSPSVAELVIVGDVEKDEILPKLNFLNSWQAKNVVMPKLTTETKIDRTKIYLVDKVKAPQSEIRIGYLTDMKYDATGEFFKVGLMNYNLGGAFNSRINLNLREDKGYTYGARSFFSGNDEPGAFTASAGVRGNVTDSAIAEFMYEITKFSDKGITADELTFMKNSIGQRDARNYETPGQKAGFLRSIIHYDLDKNYVSKQNKIIDKMTVKEINDLAKKHLTYDKMNIVVVGDKESIAPGLARLGYEIILVDEKGNIIEDNTSIKSDK